MAQQVTGLGTKPADSSVIPRVHRVERTDPCELFSDLYTYTHAFTKTAKQPCMAALGKLRQKGYYS